MGWIPLSHKKVIKSRYSLCTAYLSSENLAYIFYYGFGTEVDYAKAYLYFSKAALLGRYEATYKLGDMFRYGFYVEKNDKMTAYLYRKALDLVWKDDMCEQKYAGCVYQRVADLFYEGIGVEKNDAEEFRYYQLAEGYYFLGFIAVLFIASFILINRASKKDTYI